MQDIPSLIHDCTTHYVKDIVEICSPLYKYFKIHFFNFSRLYPDGRTIILTTSPEWIDHYVKCNYPIDSSLMSSGVHLGSSYLPSQVLEDGYTFDFAYPIAIFNSNPEYVEFFSFATNVQNKHAISSYLNNLDLLNKFADYFQHRASHIIITVEKEWKIKVPTLMQADTLVNEPIAREEFLKEIHLDDKLVAPVKTFSFTIREKNVNVRLTR